MQHLALQVPPGFAVGGDASGEGFSVAELASLGLDLSALGNIKVMGPKIEEGRVGAAAAQAYSEMALAASAINRYRLAREVSMGAGAGDIQTYVVDGYLDRVPVNPVLTSDAAQLTNAAGKTVADVTSAGGDVTTFMPRYVMLSLADDQLMCTWFARQVASVGTGVTVSASNATLASGLVRQAGCFRTSEATGNVAVGDYVAYVRI